MEGFILLMKYIHLILPVIFIKKGMKNDKKLMNLKNNFQRNLFANGLWLMASRVNQDKSSLNSQKIL